MICLHRKTVNRTLNGSLLPHNNTITVNCGKCLACRINKANSWIGRCIVESLNNNMNLFITLTYDDNNLIYDKNNIPILEKFELQNLFKRMRKRISNIKYFAVGEYGGQTYRPHFHILLFIKKHIDFELLYTMIYSSWNKGHIQVKEMALHNIKYVVRYFIEKNEFISNLFKENGIQPPFCLMSKRPAIGSDIIQDPKRLYAIIKEGRLPFNGNYPIPEYYRKKASEINNDLYRDILENRFNENYNNHMIDFHNNINLTDKMLKNIDKNKSILQNQTAKRSRKKT